MLNHKIKNHVKKHSLVYFVGATCVVAGFTTLIMRGRCSRMPSVMEPGMQSVTGQITSFSFFSKTTNTNVVSVLEKEGRGHPGYLVRHLETGAVYENQGAAARSVGAYPSIMSQHLRGLREDVHGEHFERLDVLSN